DNRREGADPSSLLGSPQLPSLSSEAAVHTERRATGDPVGARGGDRSDATPPGSCAVQHAYPPQTGRASLRHDQSLDRLSPLPDEEAEERQNRDQPARSGLQSETGDGDPRDQATHGRHPGLRSGALARRRRPPRRQGPPSFYTASAISGP